MSATLLGRIGWGRKDDDDGHREYKVAWLIETSSVDDGPQIVANCPLLPLIGALWTFGNDLDLWAFCHPQMTVDLYQEKEGDPHKYWKVVQTFSTRPLNRCQDEGIEDPLLEPQKVSGSWVTKRKEAVYDKDHNFIKSSSHEPLRGPQNEWDDSVFTVRVEQNVASLGLATFSSMRNCVNDASLWGVNARCVKLDNASWERKIFKLCDYYYTRTFEFSVNPDTFDRDLMDEGTKVLKGHWDTAVGTGAGQVDWILEMIDGADPDPLNPNHFIRYKDRHDENARIILDGGGLPADTWVWDTWGNPLVTGSAGKIHVEYYQEADFLTLGIPVTF